MRLYFLKIGLGKEHFMKHIRLMIVAAVCGVALLFIARANAQDVKQGVVTIVRIHGDATFTTDSGATWQPLKLGAILQPGAVIKTAPDATVDIVLGQTPVAVSQGGGVGINNAGAYAAGLPPTSAMSSTVAVQQNVIRMLGGTELAIDTLTFSNTGAETTSDTELDLKSGKIFGNVKKISAMSKYEIKTPVGVAGIRGTSFSLGSDGSVICTEGSVVIAATVMINGVATLVTVTVDQGEEFNPANYSPSAPVTTISGDITDAINAQLNAMTYSSTTAFETTSGGTTVYISPN
jgi:hypothetical protein